MHQHVSKPSRSAPNTECAVCRSGVLHAFDACRCLGNLTPTLTQTLFDLLLTLTLTSIDAQPMPCKTNTCRVDIHRDLRMSPCAEMIRQTHRHPLLGNADADAVRDGHLPERGHKLRLPCAQLDLTYAHCRLHLGNVVQDGDLQLALRRG